MTRPRSNPHIVLIGLVRRKLPNRILPTAGVDFPPRPSERNHPNRNPARLIVLGITTRVARSLEDAIEHPRELLAIAISHRYSGQVERIAVRYDTRRPRAALSVNDVISSHCERRLRGTAIRVGKTARPLLC